jgi:phosphate transport system substrate-binding protein
MPLLIKNSAGKFVAPSLDATEQAVSNAPIAKHLPAGHQSWSKVSLLNSPGSNTYPIASFTYLLVPKDMSTHRTLDQAKAKALTDFIAWANYSCRYFAMTSLFLYWYSKGSFFFSKL